MTISLESKTALVTGGGSGIGRATAIAFANAGASVVVADVNENAGAETVAQIEAASGTALFVAADVSQSASVENMVDVAVATYGGLDCAFNNAGIQGALSQTADCDEENWDRITGINLKGVWLCMKYEIAQMLKQGSGAIVNNSSNFGLVGSKRYACLFCQQAWSHRINKNRSAGVCANRHTRQRCLSWPRANPSGG